MKNIKVVFMGTPLFALNSLTALYESYNVVAVVCQPDKPGSRGEVVFSPIKEFALNHNIKVLQPVKISDEYGDILKLTPDVVVTCAYGQIIPKEFLDAVPYGCINIHASLLPKLRGGAPIHRAIIDGYDKTGVTIMKMSPKMDDGDIISMKSIPILDSDTAGSLHDKLSILGQKLIIATLPSIINKTATYTRQKNEDATFAWNISKEDEKIDYSKSTREIVNQIRGLNPWPGAYSILNGKRVKIWNSIPSDNHPDNNVYGQVSTIYEDGIGVKTGNGEIIITELQLEGRKKMSAKDFMNGAVNKDLLLGRIFE